MKQINLIYYSVFFLWYLLSLLPLRFLYFISDLLFYPLYYCIRYRRKIIRNNLSNSFPEKDLKEIVQIEKQFYSFFCDYIVETLKLFSISKKQLMRRMTFEGLKWNSIHHWTEFLNQETPVFIGTEKIGKQVDALIYYADVTRVKRGYYHCRLKPLCDTPRQVPDFELTDLFTRELEQTIKAHPQYWLWSHNRWKRTKEEWLRRQQEETK